MATKKSPGTFFTDKDIQTMCKYSNFFKKVMKIYTEAYEDKNKLFEMKLRVTIGKELTYFKTIQDKSKWRLKHKKSFLELFDEYNNSINSQEVA